MALGGLYIVISIFALPRIGVALLIAMIVVGQMLASLAVALVGGVLLMKTG